LGLLDKGLHAFITPRCLDIKLFNGLGRMAQACGDCVKTSQNLMGRHKFPFVLRWNYSAHANAISGCGWIFSRQRQVWRPVSLRPGADAKSCLYELRAWSDPPALYGASGRPWVR